MIIITGDTHGEQARFINFYEEHNWTKDDIVIVCGDFGFLFLNNQNEQSFLDTLEELPFTICFVDGNHENFPAIFSYHKEEWNGGSIHRIRKNVIHLMRGQVFTIEGKKIFTMGGAFSIDSHMRTLNTSYWLEELPSSEEYAEAIKNLRMHKNSVDYVLTHTCPTEVIHLMKIVPHGKDKELTGFLDYVFFEVQFKHWYFGHWHLDKDITDNISAVWFNTVCIE